MRMRRAPGLVFVIFAVACTTTVPPTPPPSPTTAPPPATTPATTTPTAAPKAATTAPAPERTETALVVAVTDGDTIRVRFPDGREEPVRIIGIDAPERGEPGAGDSTAALAELVEGRQVTLIRDVSDRDRFGRLLRYVEAGGSDVGLSLVATGWAVAKRFPPDVTRAEVLEAAEAHAREAGLGLWATTTTSVAASRGAVYISAIRFDAAGNDNENKNDEWVEIGNGGEVPVDLGGWRLEDEGPNHVFVFPTGFSLAPGATVRVHSGCGTPTGTDLFWCSTGSAVWNNSGDVATLVDASGVVVDRRPG